MILPGTWGNKIMNAITFNAKVKETFLKYFPNGYIGSFGYTFGGGLYWKAGLIRDVKDCSGGYRENDVLQLTFGIEKNFKRETPEEIEGKIVVEFQSAVFYTEPDAGSYLAMQRNKVPSRKINNVPEKVLETLDKYFNETRDLMKVQIENNKIYGQARIPQQYLEI